MKKLLTAITALALTAAVFTSCHDDIYYKILQEVPLETKGISGDIESIVRYTSSDSKEYMYLANGKIYRRDITQSSNTTALYNEQWERVINPTDSASDFYGKKFIYLASDSTGIYAMATEFEESDTGYNIQSYRQIWYSSNGGSTKADWTDITATLTAAAGTNATGTDSVTALKTLFDNKAYEKANRRAYIRMNKTVDSTTTTTVWLLNGTGAPVEVTANGANSSTISATCFNGTDYFGSAKAFDSNSKYIYYASGSQLYYVDRYDTTNSCYRTGADDADAAYKSLGHGTILDLAVSSDYILLGTTSGIGHVAIDSNGVPADATSEIGNNAESALSSSYYVCTTFARDPSSTETDNDLWATTTIYGSISSSSTTGLFDELGLWAYYPNRTAAGSTYGTWNKDGTSDGESKGN